MATKKCKPAVKKETKCKSTCKKNNCQPNPLGAETKRYMAMKTAMALTTTIPCPWS